MLRLTHYTRRLGWLAHSCASMLWVDNGYIGVLYSNYHLGHMPLPLLHLLPLLLLFCRSPLLVTPLLPLVALVRP